MFSWNKNRKEVYVVDELKENILEFIDTSFDELANADVPFFKQTKAIFNVISAGGKIIESSHNSIFEKYKTILKSELKILANSPHTDLNHLNILLNRLKGILSDCDQPLHLFINVEQLEKKLREGTNIPHESRLPQELALIIRNNIEKLVSTEEWCRGIFEQIDDISAESQARIRNFEQQLGNITTQISYKGSFQEYLDNAVLPVSRSRYENRLLYSNDTLPLCGRDIEIQNLHNFLFSDMPVAVWAICGQGGVGKSKLARHICQKYDQDFKFVWLKDADFHKIAQITSGYMYYKPVVFVCDYADERERNIVDLIDSIYNSNEIEARFILLSRDENWYPRFVQENDVIREVGFKISDKYEPLNLSQSDLGNETFGQIIRKFQEAFYQSHSPLSDDNINFILNKVKIVAPTNSQNTRANRCLFVLLIADFFLQNPGTAVDNLNQLLLNFFERSKKHLKYSDEITVPGFRLLALSTALRGIRIDDETLPDFIKTDIAAINKGFSRCRQNIENFWRNISDNSFEENTIHPYEPDLIGEYLFLWQFFDKLIEEDRRKWCEYLIKKVQAEEDENPVEIFINRCTADWREYGENKNFFAYYSQIQQKMNESEINHV